MTRRRPTEDSSRDRAVTRYLDEVRVAVAHLPPIEQHEILTEIQSHIETRLAESPAGSDDVRAVLRDLGQPASIVPPPHGQEHSPRARVRTAPWGAVLLGLLSMVSAIVYWPVGIVLSLATVAFGVISRRRGRSNEAGVALVLGSGAFIVCAVILVFLTPVR